MSENRPAKHPVEACPRKIDQGEIWDMQGCAHLATLRHFDNKLMGQAKTGHFIPCERRLGKMEI